MFKKANVRMKRNKSHLNKGSTDRDAISDSHTGKQPRPLGRKVLISAVLAMAAVTVPVLFATAEGSGEITTSAFIPIQQTASPSPSPLPSDLTWDLSRDDTPATMDGTLTSDLTETETQVAENAETAPSPAPEASPDTAAAAIPAEESIYRTFSPGMEDQFITQIQQRLMDLEYMEHDEPTTLFGPITAQAIQYFQRKNELPVDGIAGPQTQELLFSENAKYYTVLEGTTGPDVEAIQDRLMELGYTVNNTGYFGTDTTKAVAYFQRMNGLVDDGNVGSQTREALFSKDAEPSLEYAKKKADESKKSTEGSSSNGSGSSGSSGSSSSESKSSDSGDSSGDSSGGGDASVPAADPGNVEAFIDAAFAQLGKSYVWGGKGPNVFDCSGFVYYALKTSGNGIGYMTSASWAQSGYARIDRMEDLQRGDVICYKGHVGIYLGDGTMIDASSSEGKIRVSSNIFTSSYWTSHFICGRRVF
jgi:cell wall-associated NlpC family hydrolase